MLITVDLFRPAEPYNASMFRLKVKEALDAKKVSQGRLSRGANIPSSLVQRLCNDPHYIPSSLTLVRVARFLRVSMDDLVEYHEDPLSIPD